MQIKIPKPQIVQAWRRTAREPGRKFSQILTDIAEDDSSDRVSLADLVSAMGDRAFGALLFVFALPNILPSPPGTSAILGIPLMFLSGQLMLGRQPWLPQFIANRSILRADFASIVARATPWLAKAEKLLRPRLSGLVQKPAEFVIGAACLLMALTLALPIPFANSVPALTICLFALGVLERDGAWVIAGSVMALVSGVLAAVLGYTLIRTVILVINNAFF